MHKTNWAGNITFGAKEWHCPETMADIQSLVAKSKRLKTVGSRHSFSTVADTDGDALSLECFDWILSLDPGDRTVTVQGGVRYGVLGAYLHQRGYALHNMASLPHITVAGAAATGTHGSGVGNGNLATAFVGIEFVAGNGQTVCLTRDDPDFAGAVVNLGALGVVTQLTLRIEPNYEVRQDVYENLPFDQWDNHAEEILSGSYSVSLFTDWKQPCFNQVWRKSRVDQLDPATLGPQYFGATAATAEMHPISDMATESCTAQLGVPGPWYDRLPHFRLAFRASAGEELQAEYFVPRRFAVPALHAINALRDRIAPHLMVSEIRSVAADDLWLSPFYERDSIAFHFTWKRDWPAVREVLMLIEAGLAPFAARPHWGKLFTTAPGDLRRLYPRLPDFQSLRHKYDPDGKFSNAFLREHLGE